MADQDGVKASAAGAKIVSRQGRPARPASGNRYIGRYSITEFVAGLGERLIGSIGYGGLFLLMVAESVVRAFSLWGVILVSTLGSLVGSLLSYGLGRFGGRRSPLPGT